MTRLSCSGRTPSGAVIAAVYGERVQRIEAAIPSPTISVIHLGPLPIHIYALCIVAGIIVAILLTDRRWRARGGKPQQVGDVAGWAVVFGIIGGRLYHVITDPELYFTKGQHPINALKIWDGGLGIWGAIALGGVGAYIGCRRHKLDFVAFADCAAPGIIIAQAIGRLGNWFNNELYGDPTTVLWRLQIHDMDVITGRPRPCSFGAIGQSVCGYYQPTFLYELVWNLLIAALLLWADRRFRLARGQVFALYVMGYTAGRFVIEALRSDHANRIFGVRVNNWVALLVFLGGLAFFLAQRGKPRSTAQPAGMAVEDSDAGAAPAESEAGATDPGATEPGEGQPGDGRPGEGELKGAIPATTMPAGADAASAPSDSADSGEPEPDPASEPELGRPDSEATQAGELSSDHVQQTAGDAPARPSER
jgi:phosphatidylglycerol---prolipoprotein diacylglyceryl transferase